MELKEYKLGEVCERFSSGKSISAQSVHDNGKIPVVGGNGVRGYTSQSNFKGQCFTIGRQGAYCGNVHFFSGEYYMTEHAIVGVGNNLADTYYLYCLLSLIDLNRLSSQSTQPGLSVETLSLQTIKLPSIEYQKKVSTILKSLEDKINLNRQINDNLEALARQLYYYWFVQFDFPDDNGKPYKSSGGKMVWNEKLHRNIPDGWYATNICKIADILSGGTPSKSEPLYWDNGTIPFFGPTDCNGSVFQLQTKDHITSAGLEHCASSLYGDGVVIITARGSIGKLVIVGTPMAMNQSCYALKSKTGEYEYLYFLTIQLIEWLKAKGNGSVFKSIISSDIETSTLCIGKENIVSMFCEMVKPIFEKIKASTKEIIDLTKQRGELLPLLMNGQVVVTAD